MYKFDIEEKLHKTLQKLFKKDKKRYETIWKKISEIVNCFDVNNYKNLRHDLKEFKRVHIGQFVLIFKYDEKSDRILFYDLGHHDKIYFKKY